MITPDPVRPVPRGAERPPPRTASMARARLASHVRILALRARLGRRIEVSFRTMVMSGCRITVARGGLLVLDGAHLNRFVSLDVLPGGRLEIGSSFIGVGSMLSAHRSVVIGNGCQIAEYASIRDHNHVHDSGTALDEWVFTTKPIAVHDDVWIGSKSTITAGVTIGEHVTCGAGAVVTKNVPPGDVVVGVPARSLRGNGLTRHGLRTAGAAARKGTA